MLGLVLCDVVYDGLQRERAAGVWSEGVLRGGDDVVLGEVAHELLVDDGVEELGDDGELLLLICLSFLVSISSVVCCRVKLEERERSTGRLGWSRRPGGEMEQGNQVLDKELVP